MATPFFGYVIAVVVYRLRTEIRRLHEQPSGCNSQHNPSGGHVRSATVRYSGCAVLPADFQ